MIKAILQFGGAILVAIVCLVSQSAPTAFAQNRLTMQGPPEESGAAPIRDALNRPCLDVEAAARAHVIDPKVVDHVVSIKNTCSRLINVKVCYLHSDRCNDLRVMGYARIDTVLGTSSAKIFRYSITQR